MVKTIKADNEYIEVRIHPFDIGGIIDVKEKDGKNLLHIDFPDFLTEDEVSFMDMFEDDYINLQKDIIKFRKEQEGVLKVILKGVSRGNGVVVDSFEVSVTTDPENAEDCGVEVVKGDKSTNDTKEELTTKDGKLIEKALLKIPPLTEPLAGDPTFEVPIDVMLDMENGLIYAMKLLTKAGEDFYIKNYEGFQYLIAVNEKVQLFQKWYFVEASKRKRR